VFQDTVLAERQRELAELWHAGQFEPQIHHIRFLNYKNLQQDLRIEFDHPITVLIGQNGTNKTSILRALQGCPANQNIGRYWYGTALDRVPGRRRPRVIYGRFSQTSGSTVEMLKMRVRRRDATGELDPDYWEPAESNISLGMDPMPPVSGSMPGDRTEDRWSQLEKDVVYIDFRSEVSAYDKYFFHHDYRRRTKDVGSARVDPIRRRKGLIRDNSEKLRRIIERRRKSYKQGGREWVIEPARKLSNEELYWVCQILEKNYRRIVVVSHRAFQVEGTTAILFTDRHSYSEAWAGSGEFAVIQLVTAVLSAKKASLILLDEPEVSLYPGAQRNLMYFLSAMAKKGKHQIVFATHSPALVESLPPNALKVLDINRDDGCVRLRSQGSSSDEAFNALGQRFEKKTVVVEDALAREIVLRAIRITKPAMLPIINVKFYPGGESILRQRDLPGWAKHKEKAVLLVLDADVVTKPIEERGDPLKDYLDEDGRVPLFESLSPSVAEATVEALCQVKNVAKDSGEDAVRDFQSVLDWANKYLRFMPGGKSPEEWLYNACGTTIKVKLKGLPPGSKEWWCQHATETLGLAPGERLATSVEILEVQKRYLAKVEQDNELTQLGETIRDFVEG
jgi:predicted ATPase